MSVDYYGVPHEYRQGRWVPRGSYAQLMATERKRAGNVDLCWWLR